MTKRSPVPFVLLKHFYTTLISPNQEWSRLFKGLIKTWYGTFTTASCFSSTLNFHASNVLLHALSRGHSSLPFAIASDCICFPILGRFVCRVLRYSPILSGPSPSGPVCCIAGGDRTCNATRLIKSDVDVGERATCKEYNIIDACKASLLVPAMPLT